MLTPQVYAFASLDSGATLAPGHDYSITAGGTDFSHLLRIAAKTMIDVDSKPLQKLPGGILVVLNSQLTANEG